MDHIDKAKQSLKESYEALKKHIGTVKADQWILPIMVLDVNNNGVVILGIKKGLAYKWVISNYSNSLREHMIKFMPTCSDVKFVAIGENQTSQQYQQEHANSSNANASLDKKTATYENQESSYAQVKDVQIKDVKDQGVQDQDVQDHDIQAKDLEIKAKEDAHPSTNHPRKSLGRKNILSFHSKKSQGLNDDSSNEHKLFDQADFTLNERYQFESFVVGEPNRLACSLANKTAQCHEPDPTLNPLFFFGGVGLGKTHLMTAIAHKYKRNFPHKNILYISTETFMYKFIESQKKRSNYDFKKELREIDMLLMDDIQFLVGKTHTEKEFLQVFKALDDQGKQIILSADSSPSDIKGMDHRIISRINQGMVANIQSTDYNLRLEIIKDKSKRLTKIKIPLEVMEFLADKITNNVRELEGALKRIIQSAELLGQPINIATTTETLSDILRSNSQSLNVKEIKKKVAVHFGIKESDLTSKSRVKNIAMARHVAVYLSKELTEKSQSAIGREFHRDHTTVINSIKKIKKEIANNTQITEDLRILETLLK